MTVKEGTCVNNDGGGGGSDSDDDEGEVDSGKKNR